MSSLTIAATCLGLTFWPSSGISKFVQLMCELIWKSNYFFLFHLNVNNMLITYITDYLVHVSSYTCGAIPDSNSWDVKNA